MRETDITVLMRSDGEKETYENEKKFIADAIVNAFAKTFDIKPDEISLKEISLEEAFRGRIISLYYKNDRKICDFHWDSQSKEISIYVEGDKGLAEEVAKNIEKNEKNKKLLEVYGIELEYDHRYDPYPAYYQYYQ